MRLVQVIALVAVAGCDRVFGLSPVPDASIDASIDASTVDPIGCADGTREGFRDVATFPRIAACAGHWNQPGLTGLPAGHQCTPADDQPCAAADLCSPGWEICANHTSVATHGAARCDAQSLRGFYATRQPSSGAAACIDDPTFDNDLFGCDEPVPRNNGITGCNPLDGTSGDQCAALVGGPWVCPDGSHELTTVLKNADVDGGVLCCKQ